MPNAERLRLYKEGFSDVKIAAITGATHSAIAQWRYRSGLKANVTKYSNRAYGVVGDKWGNVRMEDVLPEDGCRLVRSFFNDLVRCAKYTDAPDVGRFMAEWRRQKGRRVTQDA